MSRNIVGMEVLVLGESKREIETVRRLGGVIWGLFVRSVSPKVQKVRFRLISRTILLIVWYDRRLFWFSTIEFGY